MGNRIGTNDFTLGTTDDYVDGPQNAAERLDNLLINRFKKPYQRDGITIYNSDAEQIPPTNQAIDDLYYFDSTLFIKSGTKLYFIEDGDSAYTTLAGPNTDAFADSELGARCSWSEWRGHLIITAGPTSSKTAGSRTVKVYRNSSSVWTLHQAGLPRGEDCSAVEIYASSDISGTCSESSGDLVLDSGNWPNGPAGLVGLDIQLADDDFTTAYPITAQSGDTLTVTGTPPNGTLKRWVIYGVYGAGSNISSGTTYSFTFAWCLKLTYTAKVDGNDVEFIEFGTPKIDQEDGLLPISSTYPWYDGTLDYINRTYENYPIDDFEISLYRTKADGTILYHSEDVALGVDAEFDITDSNLGAEFYAQADEQYNDPVPLCYFSKVVDGYGWYAAADDIDGDFSTSRVLQSNPLVPFGVPSGNSTYAESKITSLDYAGSFPVITNRNKAYRIEGRLDTYGAGNLRTINISDTFGSVSQKVASDTDGVYLMSEQGWCYTNGFDVIFLSDHLRDTYGNLLNKDKMFSVYDSKNKHVYFATENPDYTADVNNQLVVMDEFWTRKNGEMRGVFTTASSRTGSADNLQPNSLHYDSENDVLIIGDKRGYVFKFDPDTLTDPVVNTAAAYSTWQKQGILPDLITTATSFGDSVASKWVTRLFLIFKNLTGNLSLDLFSHNDDKSSSKQFKEVRKRTTTSTGLHKIKRRFPKGGLRCEYKQVQIRKGNVIIAASDDYEELNVVGGAAVLPTLSWPTFDSENLVGFNLYLADDSYVTAYPILTQSTDTLTVTGTLPTGTVKEWQIKGIPKNEDFEMHSLAMEYEVIGESYTAYGSGDDGSNT